MTKLTEKDIDGHMVGGLILDLPTKNPRKIKKTSIKAGDSIRGLAADFKMPIRGIVKKVLDYTLIVKIENTYKEDIPVATEKNQIAVVYTRSAKIIGKYEENR